jgi:prophage regulatory protein
MAFVFLAWPRSWRTAMTAITKTRDATIHRSNAGPAYLRQAQIVGPLVPFSAATLWRKVKTGDFPAPIKLSANITAWRSTDVYAWLDAKSDQA